MIRGIDVCRERGMDLDADGSEEAFAKARLPTVVACVHCTMTMAMPNAWYDDEGYAWCGDCCDDGSNEADEADIATLDDCFGGDPWEGS